MNPGPEVVDSAPVVIVGAGPVGQSAALMLARWGVRSIVLDENSARADVGSKSLCYHRDVVDIWDSVGVGEQIASEGYTMRLARTFYRDRELYATDMVDRSFSRFPLTTMLAQRRVEEILDEAVDANALIEVRWGHRVTSLRQDGNSVTVEIDGRGEIAGPFGLICAGPRCNDLRADLGVNLRGKSFDEKFLVCDVQVDRPTWANERRFYFEPEWNPDRQVLLHACPDSTYRVDLQMSPDFDLAEERESGKLESRIRDIFGHEDFQLLWSSVYHFHIRCVDRMRNGRFFLAGDAAHLVAPHGARGLNSGVADAENVAWKIAYLLRGWGGPGLAESYDHERRAAALENLAVLARTIDFLVPRNEAARAARHKILDRADEDLSARSEIDSGRLAEPFWYSDSPLTTPAPDYPATGRPPQGQRPPAASGVLLPDGPMRVSGEVASSIRSLARNGILLLVTEGVEVDTSGLPMFGPLTVRRLHEVDPDGQLYTTLRAKPGQIWVIRPDAHIAAILDDCSVGALTAAIRRCLGYV